MINKISLGFIIFILRLHKQNDTHLLVAYRIKMGLSKDKSIHLIERGYRRIISILNSTIRIHIPLKFSKFD